MTEQVIYENPAVPLDERARWMVANSHGRIYCYEHRPVREPGGGYDPETWVPVDTGHGYAIPGPWHDSLRRIIRLSDPEWHTPENPYAEDREWCEL